MKKKRFFLHVCVLAAALLVFAGYRTVRQMNMDTVGPEIAIDSADLSLSVGSPREAYLQGVTAYDEQDGDVSDKVLVESIYGITEANEVTVTYAAFDGAGNVTKAQRQVTLSDYREPHFTLDCALVFPADSGLDVMDYIGAEDVIDGDITRRVRATLVSNSGSLLDVGTHDVLLRVTNSIGDVSELTLPAEVHAPEKYNAQMALDTYLLYLPQGASFNAESHLESFTYAGRTVALSGSSADISVSVSGRVDTGTPGIYPVAYTVSGMFNQTTYTAYSKLFVVVEE